MYVAVHHRISDPEEFWSQVQEATPNLPDHLKIHQCLPKGDGREAICVWEGPSLEEVRGAVESPWAYIAAMNTSRWRRRGG